MCCQSSIANGEPRVGVREPAWRYEGIQTRWLRLPCALAGASGGVQRMSQLEGWDRMGYDASADGQQGGMLETGYFGEDGMWYDEAEEAAAATAAAAGASGYDQGGGYDEQQAAGGYYGDDGVWYQTEQHGQEAGAESEQAGYYGDDGQWYSYDEGAGELYEEGAAAIEEEAAAPEELQEPVAGGPGYVVVTVLRARGLRKVRIAFPPRGEKKRKDAVTKRTRNGKREKFQWHQPVIIRICSLPPEILPWYYYLYSYHHTNIKDIIMS